MAEFVLTANKGHDLRYIYDDIRKSGLGLEDGAFTLRQKEKSSLRFAGGDLPMTKIRVIMNRVIEDEERLKLHEQLRQLLGEKAHIRFKDD